MDALRNQYKIALEEIERLRQLLALKKQVVLKKKSLNSNEPSRLE